MIAIIPRSVIPQPIPIIADRVEVKKAAIMSTIDSIDFKL